MSAYYNENDSAAAAGLRQLITDGLIADGFVDERSITEVEKADLEGFTQHHFFAGAGGWQYALRQAGWPDNKSVWTGSCPCPPFSCAGKKKSCPECDSRRLLPHPFETGIFACSRCGFEWFADERHLWPEFFRLISEFKPSTVFGEQVAGQDGEIWLSGVRATLEILGYGVGAANIGAHSVGAFHKRQRLFWLAYNPLFRLDRAADSACYARRVKFKANGDVDIMENSDRSRLQEQCRKWNESTMFTETGTFRDFSHANSMSYQERTGSKKGGTALQSGEAFNGDGNAESFDEPWCIESKPGFRKQGAIGRSGTPWDSPEWIYCRDGKYRAIKSGIKPLVNGVPKSMVRGSDKGTLFNADETPEARSMRLKWYGNAIVPECGAAFISAFDGVL